MKYRNPDRNWDRETQYALALDLWIEAVRGLPDETLSKMSFITRLLTDQSK